jgi:hypothetical protein
MSDFDMPENLSQEGKTAYNTIMAFLSAKSMNYGGGCKSFYSPEEWEDRGEQYGLKSKLIVVHDGGDLAQIFNLDYERYSLHDEMQSKLAEYGFFAESCTCWYTAIYSILYSI